jgi:hypothetical protein
MLKLLRRHKSPHVPASPPRDQPGEVLILRGTDWHPDVIAALLEQPEYNVVVANGAEHVTGHSSSTDRARQAASLPTRIKRLPGAPWDVGYISSLLRDGRYDLVIAEGNEHCSAVPGHHVHTGR